MCGHRRHVSCATPPAIRQRSPRCATVLAASRPRRRRQLRRRTAGPRPPPPQHHRSRRRPSADEHAPMGATSIVYNGEIYNYRELRAELEAQGVSFPRRIRHRSDPAAARAGWRRGDRATQRHLRVCALGPQQRRLLLARDRAGIKPLYYAAASRGSPSVPRSRRCSSPGSSTPRLNERRVAEYLVFRQVAGDENPVRGSRSRCRPDTRWRSSTAGALPRRAATGRAQRSPCEPFTGRLSAPRWMRSTRVATPR